MITAITGTIGSGKSAVGRFLRKNGKIVLDCDKINAELLTSTEYQKDLKTIFPNAFSDGKFIKKLLAEIVFNDRIELEKLNKFSHPYIYKILKERILKEQGNDVYVEIPLLNNEFLNLFDRIILVDCDEKIKLQRISARDSVAIEEAEKRLSCQERKWEFSLPTITIDNSFDEEYLEKQLTIFL